MKEPRISIWFEKIQPCVMQNKLKKALALCERRMRAHERHKMFFYFIPRLCLTVACICGTIWFILMLFRIFMLLP